MITYETTEQDGITYIRQAKPHTQEGYWYYRTVEIDCDRVKAPKWEVATEWFNDFLRASKEI